MPGPVSTAVAHPALLPPWVASAWTLIFIASAAFHFQHMLATRGRAGGRAWHGGHILIAAGMVAMYVPSSAVHLQASTAVWQYVFGSTALAVGAWLARERLRGQPTDLLWVLTLVDLGAMAYMWHVGGYLQTATWVLAFYFTIQAILWLTGAFARIEQRARELGPHAGIAMSLGMAWMFVACRSHADRRRLIESAAAWA